MNYHSHPLMVVLGNYLLFISSLICFLLQISEISRRDGHLQKNLGGYIFEDHELTNVG